MKRLPIGLTVAVALALAVLVGLGAWQLQRLAEKSALLARIAALQTAPPRALEPVLAAAARGDDVAYTRVATDCTATTTRAPIAFRYALRDGRVGWRLLGVCALPPGGAYDGILLDRGLVVSLGGLMAPRAVSFPPPRSVMGVLRTPGAGSFLDRPASQGPDGVITVQALDAAALRSLSARGGVLHPAPVFLAVEREAPSPPGLLPAALPQDIPNNHFVYALTWFGLAGVLIWIYAAMVLRRFRAS